MTNAFEITRLKHASAASAVPSRRKSSDLCKAPASATTVPPPSPLRSTCCSSCPAYSGSQCSTFCAPSAKAYATAASFLSRLIFRRIAAAAAADCSPSALPPPAHPWPTAFPSHKPAVAHSIRLACFWYRSNVAGATAPGPCGSILESTYPAFATTLSCFCAKAYTPALASLLVKLSSIPRRLLASLALSMGGRPPPDCSAAVAAARSRHRLRAHTATMSTAGVAAGADCPHSGHPASHISGLHRDGSGDTTLRSAAPAALPPSPKQPPN
ncbi:uncharacterized protein BcabD6B2_18550 [Babesia caballi]|uniref:Uncharacterized protein n=1 Tax=Babesia caballi TaxID=5871 RepID=A0AAV4LRI8_BABCB|nr:hypothetical protein BcabD6B2_18550 [Babesia caballi]